MKKILKSALICTLAALLLASCKAKNDTPAGVTTDTGEQTAVTTAPVEETAEYPYELTKQDGRDIVYLAPGNAWGGTLFLIDFGAEEKLEDQVDVVRYNKNRRVETDLDIHIEEYLTDDMFTMSRYFNDAVLTNLDTYDLAYILMQQYSTVMGNAVNLHDISAIHLEDGIWDQSFIDTMTAGKNALFGVIDYTNLHSLLSTGGVYFNKEMAQVNKLGNLYDDVRNNEWTYDKMGQYMSQIVNLNGDSAYLPPYKSGKCVYGCVGQHNETPLYLLQGAGRFLVQKNEEGIPQVVDDLEPLYNAYQKLADILSKDGHCMLVNTEQLVGAAVFWANRSLFYTDSMGGSVYSGRLYDLDYGTLPLPKYDEAQKSYVSPVSQYSLALMVPKTARDSEVSGMVADYMNFRSYTDVYPTLVLSMCSRGLRDEDSIEMIDIILNSHTVDIGHVNGWTQGMFELLMNDMLNGIDRFTSLVESGRDVVDNASAATYSRLK